MLANLLHFGQPFAYNDTLFLPNSLSLECFHHVQWQDEIEVVIAAAIMEEVVTIEAVAVVTTEAFEAGEAEDAVEGLQVFSSVLCWNLAEAL